jgi:hypothetical protein
MTTVPVANEDQDSVSLLRERIARLEERYIGAERALNLTRDALEVRLESMNEFRSQLEKERGGYLSRDLYEREHTYLSGRISELERARANAVGSVGAYSSIGDFVKLVLVGLIAAIVAHFWR